MAVVYNLKLHLRYPGTTYVYIYVPYRWEVTSPIWRGGKWAALGRNIIRVKFHCSLLSRAMKTKTHRLRSFKMWCHLLLLKPRQRCRYSDYVAGWRSKELWFDSQQGQKVRLSSETCRPALKARHPHNDWDFPSDKATWAWSKALTQTRAEVKNEWIYTSIYLYVLMVSTGTIWLIVFI